MPPKDPTSQTTRKRTSRQQAMPSTLDRRSHKPITSPNPKMKPSMINLVFGFIVAAGGIWLLFLYHQSPTKLVPHEPKDGYKIKFPLDDGKELFIPPLRTEGKNVVDASGQRFKLASVNWYGASDEHFIPGGLDVRHRSEIAKTIRSMGFNSVRLPYSDELVITNPWIPSSRLTANRDLQGKRALKVLEAVVNALTDAGLAVIINNHITQSTWCCGANPCDAAWRNDYLGPVCRVWQSEERWIENWQTVMAPFVNNPRVVGADLRNEVRGLWGTMPWRKWASAAQRAGNVLLGMQPNWLIIVGGVASNNDLSGVLKLPVVLDVEDRVVYEAHVYSWSGWGSLEGMYSKRSYASFAASMQRNWAYLLESGTAPVWVGEFGAPHKPGEGDMHYWVNLIRYLESVDADFGYWAINPRKPAGNESETYSLLADDWKTPLNDYRLRDLVKLMNL